MVPGIQNGENMIRDLLQTKFREASTGIRFLGGLGRFLMEKSSLDDAPKVLAARRSAREKNFLLVLRKGIFGYPKSPYLPLFRSSGMGYEDVVRLVREKGLEGALAALKEAGVYFTIEEFKGKRPVVRGDLTFNVSDKDFDNPYAASSYERRSGGTRSAGTKIEMNFDFLSETAVYRALITDLVGMSDAPHVILRPVHPYGVGMMYMLQLSRYGIYPKRWISLVKEKGLGISLRSRMGVRSIFGMGALFGVRFPEPEFFDPADMVRVAGEVAGLLKAHGKCCVFTNVSTAVRLCVAAKAAGMDLTGLKFQGCGEPLTVTKKKAISDVGAEYILYYAFAEVGLAGALCLNPSGIDDIHLFNDYMVLISYKKEFQGLELDALLATSILPSAPKIMLNVESGDHAVLKRRSCGCPYDAFGYHEHIHDIRSFEKLTGEGMTFYGSDLIKIVEDILPSRFGGSCIDYQLVEEEGGDGLTRLFVHVSPRVGPLNEQALIDALIHELKKGNDSQRVMAQVWRQAGTVQVRRKEPVMTREGKLYPLHIIKELK
jgi:hypothetical protein